MKGFSLSDGTEPLEEMSALRFIEAFKRVTGTIDPYRAIQVLSTVSSGLPHKGIEDRMNLASAKLALFEPQDEIEALLAGQFNALQEAGMRCLHEAQNQSSFYHEEKLFNLATKLFTQTNTTYQTLLKHRLKGKQVVQVVHIHNDGGQAIVAQNLSHSKGGGGLQEKSLDQPHGSL